MREIHNSPEEADLGFVRVSVADTLDAGEVFLAKENAIVADAHACELPFLLPLRRQSGVGSGCGVTFGSEADLDFGRRGVVRVLDHFPEERVFGRVSREDLVYQRSLVHPALLPPPSLPRLSPILTTSSLQL